VRLTGIAAERRYMELKWCERLWQAMQRIQMRKSRLTIRAVERAAKRQCKKDERQTKVLLAKARDWSAHVFDPLSEESVTSQAPFVKEWLQEARALAKSKGETLPWLEYVRHRRFRRT
jgi:TATA-binding protein-associated factor Taf7